MAVRNFGTLGGNLMLRHTHNDFPSDIFACLEAVPAAITVVDVASGQETNLASPSAFMGLDMKGKVMTKIRLPKKGDNWVFR